MNYCRVPSPGPMGPIVSPPSLSGVSELKISFHSMFCRRLISGPLALVQSAYP